MIILDATTKSLQFKLAGAITTNQLPFSASYVDATGTATTPGEQDGVSNNTTAVTVVSAPAASTERLIKSIVLQNADTASATVTIMYNNNSTLRNILVVTLAVGDQLIYEDGNGWVSLDKNGNIKTSSGVSSVSNSDGTLTVSPTTGGVVASLAALSSGSILVGSGSNLATARALSGDGSLSNTGAITITKTSGTAFTSYATAAVGQLPGTTTNDSASAGNIGQYVSSSIASGSAVSLTSNTNTNITSISLTAGDWDVWADGYFLGGSTTTMTAFGTSVSTTSATFGGVGSAQILSSSGTPFANISSLNAVAGPTRLSLSATTTVYMVSFAIFGTSTCSGYGIIQARRVR